jgi:hypothetical protein
VSAGRAALDENLVELLRLTQTDDLHASRQRLAELDPKRVGALVTTARAHGLEAWLAACAPSRDAVWGELAHQRARFLAAQARADAQTNSLGRLLDASETPWALLKGQTLAAGYPRKDLRYSMDVDILVSPRDFQTTVEAMVDDHYQLLDVNWPVLAREEPGQLRLRAPNGTLIDLHWHLLNHPPLRAEFELVTDVLLATAQRAHGSGLRGLSSTDLLLHTCVHAGLSGANKLLWLVDIHRLLLSEPDWSALENAASQSRTGLLVAVVLARTRSVMGSKVPTPTLRRLAGSRIPLDVERLVDRVSPLRTDPSVPVLSRAFARSLRADGRHTLLELGRHARGWLATGAPRARVTGSWLDPDSELSALHERADTQARERYFSVVAADAQEWAENTQKRSATYTE